MQFMISFWGTRRYTCMLFPISEGTHVTLGDAGVKEDILLHHLCIILESDFAAT